MAASAAGKFVSALSTFRSTTGRGLNLGYSQTCTYQQVRNYAARKGTREKAKKKKVKVVVEKKVFIPHKDRAAKLEPLPINKVRFDDIIKDPVPEDDVWIGKYHRMKTYSLAEAIECHKETHSLEMFGVPNAYVKAMIELDMTGIKASRPVTKFARLAAVPHSFDHGENRIIAVFCKDPEHREEAKKAGAAIIGGSELVSQIQSGEIAFSDYDYAIAHPNMMADLVVIKGLMKKKFPAAATGSLGVNIAEMVHKFQHGIKYNGNPHERQILYGLSEANFGRLDMETEKLEENFAALLTDLNSIRPKRPGPFIWRVRISTEMKREFLKIDHSVYLPCEEGEKVDDEEDDDDDQPIALTV
ncbi:50S ribosomal protein L1 [Venturia canescens]|uniref:50S ribosomal protein L1 n=1 Tax=Venturia canescens TaxID=32260 RepID=UPI001C9C798A|nr:50S ribosomal protein L1 [Venturia canescens]